jgi:hypothetical protein
LKFVKKFGLKSHAPKYEFKSLKKNWHTEQKMYETPNQITILEPQSLQIEE